MNDYGIGLGHAGRRVRSDVEVQRVVIVGFITVNATHIHGQVYRSEIIYAYV